MNRGKTMVRKNNKPVEEISWAALRERATKLGIPAWKLAEDNVFHIKNDELMLSISKEA
jgi:hypothetical protein